MNRSVVAVVCYGVVVATLLASGCGGNAEASKQRTDMEPNASARPAPYCRLPVIDGLPLIASTGFDSIDLSPVRDGDPSAPPFARGQRLAGEAKFNLPDELEIKGVRLVARLREHPSTPDPVVPLHGLDPKAYSALGSGWSQPEFLDQDPIRWALEPESEIHFTLDEPVDVRVLMAVIRCRAGAVTVKINGRILRDFGRADFAVSTGCNLVVPAAYVHSGRNTLTLVHNYVHKPPEIDPRRLAILFKGIIIRPADGSSSLVPIIAAERAQLGRGWGAGSWVEGRPAVGAIGPRTEFVLPAPGPLAGVLRVRTVDCSVDHVAVYVGADRIGTLDRAALTSLWGATLRLPADTELEVPLRFALAPVDWAAPQSEKPFAMIESVRMEEPIAHDDTHPAVELDIADARGALGSARMRGASWREYVIQFDRSTSRETGTYLKLASEQPEIDVQIAHAALLVVPAERPYRARANKYPLPYDKARANRFRPPVQKRGWTTRRAYPLEAGRVHTLKLDAARNPDPVLWVSPVGLKQAARLRVTARPINGAGREILIESLAPLERLLPPFKPIPLHLGEFTDETLFLDVAFELDAPLAPLALTPVLNVSLEDLRPLPSAGNGALPDILLVSIDTMRADSLSCYGGPAGHSPNLDALARTEGVRFDNCYAATPWTLPSHIAMLTGRPPHSIGLYRQLSGSRGRPIGDKLFAAEAFGQPYTRFATVATALSELGYQTEAIADGGFLRPKFGFANGFASYTIPPAINIDGTVRMVRALLSERRSRRPLFLFMHSYEVHAPYLRTDVLRESEIAAPEKVDALDRVLERYPQLSIGRMRAKLAELDLFRPEVCRALYQGGVRKTDQALGELFDELKRLGLWDRTLLIVTSDHGEEFAERSPDRFYDAHARHLYRELVHVPLIVKWPRAEHAGAVVDAPVHHLDIVPTILEAAGLDATAYGGRNLKRFVNSVAGSGRVLYSDTVTGSLPERKAVRRGRYRVISSMLRDPKFFDVIEDPFERRPLDAEQIENSEELLTALKTFSLRSMQGELVFRYRSAEPIRQFELTIEHERPLFAVFPYDGLERDDIEFTPGATHVRVSAGPDDGPTEIVFGLIDPEPSLLKIGLIVNGRSVDQSRWRVGTSRGPFPDRIHPEMAVVPLRRLARMPDPPAGELFIFAVDFLRRNVSAASQGVDDVEHLKELRALGYLGE